MKNTIFLLVTLLAVTSAIAKSELNGLKKNMYKLFRISDAEILFNSPENFTGVKGKMFMVLPAPDVILNTANAEYTVKNLRQNKL